MKKIWINRSGSFKEAEKFEARYYQSLTPKERLEIMQELREAYRKLKGNERHERRAGLRRTVKIIKRK